MRKVLLGSFHANFHFRNSSSEVRVLSFIAQWALAFATKLSRHKTRYEWMNEVSCPFFSLRCLLTSVTILYHVTDCWKSLKRARRFNCGNVDFFQFYQLIVLFASIVLLCTTFCNSSSLFTWNGSVYYRRKTLYKITEIVRVIWLVKNLWFIIPVNP